MELTSRYMGCLLGMACGDALGAPLQYMTRAQAQIRHGTVRDMIGGGWLLLRPGEYTEGTALALRLAESLVAKGAFDAEDVAGRYVGWMEGAGREPSGVLRTSLSLLAQGLPVGEASKRAHSLSGEDSADNRTLVRCVPLALAFGAPSEGLTDAAAREARVTHWDDRAAAGSAALCALVAGLLDGSSRKDAVGRASDSLAGNRAGLKNVFPDLAARSESDLRTGPFVLDSLEAALFVFLRAPTFEEAVVDAANLGGETDTIGAVAGALAGCHWGAEAIPRRWLRPLADRKVILELARSLLPASAGEREDTPIG